MINYAWVGISYTYETFSYKVEDFMINKTDVSRIHMQQVGGKDITGQK